MLDALLALEQLPEEYRGKQQVTALIWFVELCIYYLCFWWWALFQFNLTFVCRIFFAMIARKRGELHFIGCIISVTVVDRTTREQSKAAPTYGQKDEALLLGCGENCRRFEVISRVYKGAPEAEYSGEMPLAIIYIDVGFLTVVNIVNHYRPCSKFQILWQLPVNERWGCCTAYGFDSKRLVVSWFTSMDIEKIAFLKWRK